MKTLTALAALVTGVAALPAAAHDGHGLPLHAHPHGAELTLIVPALVLAALGLKKMRGR